MTDTTPSAPTAEMLAQEVRRLTLDFAHSEVRCVLNSHTDIYWSLARERELIRTRLDTAIAALARSEPPTEGKIQAVATQRQPIVPEGWIIVETTGFIRATAPDGVTWYFDQNDERREASMPAFVYSMLSAILSRQSSAAPVASDRDSLIPASQPTEPPTAEARLAELRTELAAFVAKVRDGTISAADFSPEELALARQALSPRSEPPADTAGAYQRGYLDGMAKGRAKAEEDARSEPPTGEPVAIDAQIDPGLLTRAAQLLEWYADYIAREVGAVDIERHPYRPEVEETAEHLRDARALLAEARAPGAVPEIDSTKLNDIAWDFLNALPFGHPAFSAFMGDTAFKPALRAALASFCAYQPTVRIPAQSPQAVASRIDAVDSVQEPKPLTEDQFGKCLGTFGVRCLRWCGDDECKSQEPKP
jgi:hypothetical protein